MAEKVTKLGFKRKKGYLCYVDKNGDISGIKLADRNKKNVKPVKLTKTGVKKEDGYFYFLDKKGDISRAKMAHARISGKAKARPLVAKVAAKPAKNVKKFRPFLVLYTVLVGALIIFGIYYWQYRLNIQIIVPAYEVEEIAIEPSTRTADIPSISVLFKKNSSRVPQSKEKIIKNFANRYSARIKSKGILIEGYTCDKGADKVNKNLSRRRANAVRAAFIAAGVPAEKIETKWYGKEKYGKLSYKNREEYWRANVFVK
jgi:hypothetical protein